MVTGCAQNCTVSHGWDWLKTEGCAIIGGDLF